MKTPNSIRAFTLVEIMIVVAIIGALALISIPGFFASREATIKNTCLVDIKQIEGSLTRAKLETDVSISNLSENDIRVILEPDYMEHVPSCPRGVYSTDGLGVVHCSAHSP